MFDDILIAFGSAIKALGNNKIGGHLVRFTNKNQPDLAGDYFDKDTDFGFEGSIKTPIYLNHRLPLKTADGKEIVVKKKIGEGTLTKDDDGILIEAILYNRKQYEKALSAMGWSSGSASHLVDRTKTGKSFHVDTWPLGLDASLTPEPCDPGNVCSLKSYAATIAALDLSALKAACPSCNFENEDGAEVCSECGAAMTAKAKPAGKSLAARLSTLIDDLVDSGQDKATIIKSLAREAICDVADVEAILCGTILRPPDATLKAFARTLNVSFDTLREIAGAPTRNTIKGMFQEKLAERTPSRWEMDSVFCQVIKDVATVAKASQTTDTDFDVEAKVKEVVNEYMAALEPLVSAQISDYVATDSDEPFYLKTVSDLRTTFDYVVDVDLDSHSELVVAAARGYEKRMRGNYAKRASTKAGRVLSEANRKRIGKLMGDMKGIIDDLQSLLDISVPKVSDAEKRAALTAYLRSEWRDDQLGA